VLKDFQHADKLLQYFTPPPRQSPDSPLIVIFLLVQPELQLQPKISPIETIGYLLPSWLLHCFSPSSCCATLLSCAMNHHRPHPRPVHRLSPLRVEPPPCCCRRRSRRQAAAAVALSRWRQRCCRCCRAAAKLPPTSRCRAAATAADAAATALLPPSCGQCRAVALPPPPQPPRC
jgi:hypothetical protein